MDASPAPMLETTPENCILSTKIDTSNGEKYVKKEVELIIEDSETNSSADSEECSVTGVDDVQYYDAGADDGEYLETGSESSCHFEYEPEVKRPYLDLSNLKAKKRICFSSSSFVYAKYVMRQCPTCDYEFSSAYSWKQHIKFIHHLEKSEDLQFKYNEVGAKCKVCDYQTTTPEFNKLLEHQISHMPFSHYLKCKLCEWKTKTHSSMNLHLRQKHSEKLEVTKETLELRSCPYCHQEFSSQWYLRKHMIQEHEHTIESRTCFICLDCGLEFSTNVSLRTHVYEKFAHKSVAELGFKEVPAEGNEEAKFKCTQCPTSFRKIRMSRTSVCLREHYMLHLGEPLGKCAYKCRYCDESFRRFDNIRLHICAELRNVVQNCAGVSNASRMLHQRRKKVKKCGKGRSIRKRKILDSSKCILHVCLKCGRTFPNLAQCRQHMFRIHGMNKPEGLDFRKLKNQGASDIYECIICEEFTCEYDLNAMFVHARIHTIFEPLQCQICNMSFAYESELRGHGCLDEESVPTVAEPKKSNEVFMRNMDRICPKCNQIFTRPFSLNRHMNKVHGMNEPYGLGFEICELDNISEKMYRCNECKYFTAEERDLKAMLDHARQHFPFESFRCTMCKERIRLKEDAIKHQCSNDGREFDDKNDDDILAKTRLNKMGRLCPQCGKIFNKTYLCRTHLIKVHGIDKPTGLAFEKVDLADETAGGDIEETYRCMICLTYTAKLDLDIMLEHAREHFPFESFWCKLCNERFKLKVQAKQHKCPNSTIEEDNDGEADNSSSKRYPKNFEKCIRKFCPECNTEASSMSTWRWHMSRYHEMTTLSGLQMKKTIGNLVECLVCQVQTTNKRRQEHRFIHLPFKPFQCKYCSEYFTEVEKAKSHCRKCALALLELPEAEEQKQEETNSKSIKVSAGCVEKKFKSSVEIKATNNECNKQKNEMEIVSKLHDQYESESDCENEDEDETTNKGISVVLADDKDFVKFVKISCPLCPDTEFDSNLYLSRHFKEAHNFFRDHFKINQTNSANCKSCNKFFNVIYKKSMIKHYLSEISATCFCCRLCEKKTLYLDAMRSHLLDDHEGVIAAQKPDRCSTSFNSTDNSDPLKVTSIDISKVSSTTMAIQTNKTTVFNEFNIYISYACPECNEPFDTSEQWHLHINGEHNFFDHKEMNIEATPDGFKRCTQCGINISGSVLAEQRHKLTHMKYKSFICTLCQHRSATLGVLTQHFRRRHFTKGSFKCCLCSLVLSTSCEKILHIRGDHDPSEYPPELCRICYSHFTSVKYLHNHMVCHNPNRKSFSCDFCDRTYWYKNDLSLHVRSKHPDQEAGDSE